MAAADFAECFVLKPGVSWSNGQYSFSTATASFGGKPSMVAITHGDGVRTAEYFDPSGRVLLAEIQYGIAGFGGDPAKAAITDEYDAMPTFPQRAKPGEQFHRSGKGVRFLASEPGEAPEAIEYRGMSNFTFVGFVDLEATVNGVPRTFANTCHLKAQDAQHTMEYWYAPGYGPVRKRAFSNGTRLFDDTIRRITEE
ncbi:MULTISPECIES: hypothetical protein [Stenotrophomonas]|jgi:hypothetical protein|uniref:hypothetical protein n=1 Tax=Stenotrophomonas TaxID=40323 RepID=UPI00092AF754|nr:MULTISPECIES: hypothetical protein [Stenotrophomonas]AVJ31579.1 hypothetical protein CLM74_01730 [Stenotrophomonas sp. MYb57]MCK6233096.1 hypothetical protein [Stenotrophomonas indicatrix]OJH78320.1 MAG: hypothetical protein BSK19_18700 [Stenotrophomonas maltophilia]QXQ02897.1 hypothetical protein KX724_01900 [Stenotrophomonas indicatrix]